MRKTLKIAHNRPEVKKRHSDASVRNWQNPEFIQKQQEGQNITPNKAELKLNDLLQQALPGEYKFVGDLSFVIAGKCPDFLNVNGQKKLIELFGDYWHRGDTGEERIALFKQYGFQTLIVWEKELKDENALKEKLLNFNAESEYGK